MRLRFLLAITTAAALALGGCSMPDDDSGSSPGGGGAQGKLGAAGFDNATKPIVKATLDSTYSAGSKVDIAIMGLKVSGRLATLNVQMTPHLAPGGEGNPNPYKLNGSVGLDTALIDPVNLKRYVVVTDSANKSLESDDIFTHLVNNQATSLYYTFAAPPENVKSVDVQIGSWPTFRNVPIER